MRRIWMAIVVGSMLAALAPPIAAQDWSEYFDRVGRRADMRLLVYDPDRTIDDPDGTIDPATGGIVQLPRPGYVSLTLAMLLDGLVTFPDTLIRYVQLVAFDANDPSQMPTITPASFVGASTGVGTAQGIQLPSVAIETRWWVVFAAPAGTDVPYLSVQQNNAGFNFVGLYQKLDNTVALGSPAAPYDVWISRDAQNYGLDTSLYYMFLDVGATRP